MTKPKEVSDILWEMTLIVVRDEEKRLEAGKTLKEWNSAQQRSSMNIPILDDCTDYTFLCSRCLRRVDASLQLTYCPHDLRPGVDKEQTKQ